MRKFISTLIVWSSFSATQAQHLENLISKLNKGTRKDTIISFNSRENTLENMPLTIIKGANPGAVFTIVAGVHGYEYPPIVAVQKLMQEIDANRLRGTLLVIPIANRASFYKRSPFVNPVDGKNLNTAFPGSATGSSTDRIAHWITKQVIPLSEVFLDIHGGDANEDLIPFVCYYNNQNDKEQTEKARLLSEASGMRYIISYPYNITKTEPAKYAFKQAVQDGKVGVSIEAGKLGTVQNANVTLIKDAVYNMLHYRGMYKTKKTATSVNRRYLYQQTYIRALQQGIFYSSIKSGDIVAKDQQLGYITDDFGNVIHNISASVSGIVLYKVGTPPVNAGETLFCIGY